MNCPKCNQPMDFIGQYQRWWCENCKQYGPQDQQAMPNPTTPQDYSEGVQVPHRGGTVLTMGILSLALGCFIFGIIAWVMGAKDTHEIDSGRMDRSGRGMTTAGKIMGIIGTTVISPLTLLYIFALIAAGGDF